MSPFYRVSKDYQVDGSYFIVRSVEPLAEGRSLLVHEGTQIPVTVEETSNETHLRIHISEAQGDLDKIDIYAFNDFSINEDSNLVEEILLRGREWRGAPHLIIKGEFADPITPDLSIEYYEGEAPFKTGDNWGLALKSKERK